MEKYVSPAIRIVDINSSNIMTNPIEDPDLNPISNVDKEGEGDQLTNGGLEDNFEVSASKSVWGPEE